MLLAVLATDELYRQAAAACLPGMHMTHDRLASAWGKAGGTRRELWLSLVTSIIWAEFRYFFLGMIVHYGQRCLILIGFLTQSAFVLAILPCEIDI